MKRLVVLLLMVLSMATGQIVAAELKVVTSTTDLAYFGRQVGGENVEIISIAAPTADLHFIEARPSYMVKVAKADVVLRVGLELDMWMDNLIDGSRNSDLEIVDCSRFIEPMEVPTFKVDASRGEIHPQGNPHYWLGPDNVPKIIHAVVDGFVTADPEHADMYQANAESYLAEFQNSLTALDTLREQVKDLPVVFYHNSWPYFARYTGVDVAGFIEPFPGVPPSPSQVKKLVDLIKARQIKVIAIEPYFDRRVPDHIAELTGAKVVTVFPSVGGRSEGESYVDNLRDNLMTIVGAGK